MAAQEKKQMYLKRVRSRVLTGPRNRSTSAPRDAFKRTCWSIHSRTNRTKRNEFIEMVIDLMTNHGGAKR